MDTPARRKIGYADGPVTKPPNWHGLVVVDVLLNNLTTGLFLVAAIGDLAMPETFAEVAKAAYRVALILLIADLLCLVLDLGDVWRFHHMLRVFKPTSPMSLGTWCLTAYSLPLTVAAGVSLWPGEGVALEWTRKVAVIAGILPALGSAVYKGVLFSTSSQPGWRDARWLGAYLTNSALALGCAEMLAISVLMDRSEATVALRPALGLLLPLNLAVLGLLAWGVRATLTRAYRRGSLAGLGALAGGAVLVPLALLAEGGGLAMLAAVLFVVLGALVVRAEIVLLPHRLGRSEGE